MSTANPVCTLHHGSTPLVISIPHCGTAFPPEVAACMSERALEAEDTDWHLDRLYAFAASMGASLLVPRYSRYVIDLNRPPTDTPMYAGQNNTELCPTRHFTGEPIHREGGAPDAAEVQRRIAAYWRPYHDALRAELDRVKALHGHAVLFDAHSIKSELPWLFEGTLPHLNVGTVGGSSCDTSLRDAVAALLAAQHHFSFVIDGRFKGGHITRHYGDPAGGVHAVQLEMCWRAYMADEAEPRRWDPSQASAITPLLRALLETLRDWRPAP
jgi:N-formylglutamate deformylase